MGPNGVDGAPAAPEKPGKEAPPPPKSKSARSVPHVTTNQSTSNTSLPPSTTSAITEPSPGKKASPNLNPAAVSSKRVLDSSEQSSDDDADDESDKPQHASKSVTARTSGKRPTSSTSDVGKPASKRKSGRKDRPTKRQKTVVPAREVSESAHIPSVHAVTTSETAAHDVTNPIPEYQPTAPTNCFPGTSSTAAPKPTGIAISATSEATPRAHDTRTAGAKRRKTASSSGEVGAPSPSNSERSPNNESAANSAPSSEDDEEDDTTHQGPSTKDKGKGRAEPEDKDPNSDSNIDILSDFPLHALDDDELQANIDFWNAKGGSHLDCDSDGDDINSTTKKTPASGQINPSTEPQQECVPESEPSGAPDDASQHGDVGSTSVPTAGRCGREAKAIAELGLTTVEFRNEFEDVFSVGTPYTSYEIVGKDPLNECRQWTSWAEPPIEATSISIMFSDRIVKRPVDAHLAASLKDAGIAVAPPICGDIDAETPMSSSKPKSKRESNLDSAHPVSLDANHFAHSSVKTTGPVEFIVRMPFDIFANSRMREHAEAISGSMPTKQSLNAALKTQFDKAVTYAQEARRRATLQKLAAKKAGAVYNQQISLRLPKSHSTWNFFGFRYDSLVKPTELTREHCEALPQLWRALERFQESKGDPLKNHPDNRPVPIFCGPPHRRHYTYPFRRLRYQDYDIVMPDKKVMAFNTMIDWSFYTAAKEGRSHPTTEDLAPSRWVASMDTNGCYVVYTGDEDETKIRYQEAIGVTASSLPPWTIKTIENHCSVLITFCTGAVRRLAYARGWDPERSTHGSRRRERRWDDLLLEVLMELFGGAAVVDGVDGRSKEFASFPEGTAKHDSYPYSGYRRNVMLGGHALIGPIKNEIERRFKQLSGADNEVLQLCKAHTTEEPLSIATMAALLPKVQKYGAVYGNATPPDPWGALVQRLAGMAFRSGMHGSAYLAVSTAGQHIERVLEKGENVLGALKEILRQLPVEQSDTLLDAIDAPFFDISLGDIGVGPFSRMDPWDMVVELGLENLHLKEQRRLARKGAKLNDVHSCIRGEDGLPVRDQETREVKRVHPRHHDARSAITIPYFNRFGRAKDPVAWQSAVDANPNLKPSEATHCRNIPQAHQLAAVCATLSRGYISPEHSKPPSHSTLLADEPGMGQGWVFMILICILRYYRSQGVVAPIMKRNDPCYQYKGVDMFVTGPKPEWIGDIRRRGHHNVRAHLFVVGRTQMTSKIRDEANSVLDPKRFIVNELPPGSAWGTERKLNMEAVMQQAEKDGKEVLFIQSIETLVTEAWRLTCTYDYHHSFNYNNSASQFSLLDRRFVFDTLFIDNVDDFRNPTSRYFATLRRLVAKACVVIGASGTPIIDTQQDLFNLGRLLDFPTIINEPSTAVRLLCTHHSWGCILVGAERISSAFDFSNATPAARDICSKIHRCEMLMKKYSADVADAQSAHDPHATRQSTTDNDSDAPPDLATCREEFVRDILPVIDEMMSPFIIRRTHSSVGYDGLAMTDITPLPLVLEEVGLQAEEMAYYLDWRAKTNPLPDLEGFVESCMMLNAPRLLREGHFKPYEYTSASWHLLANHILKSLKLSGQREPRNKERHLIHTQFQMFVPQLREYLAYRGIQTVAITSKTSQTERDAIIENFNKDEGAEVAIGVDIGTFNDAPVYHIRRGSAFVMIVANVEVVGINLQRATQLHLFDPPSWTYLFKPTSDSIEWLTHNPQVKVRLYCHIGNGISEPKLLRFLTRREGGRIVLVDPDCDKNDSTVVETCPQAPSTHVTVGSSKSMEVDDERSSQLPQEPDSTHPIRIPEQLDRLSRFTHKWPLGGLRGLISDMTLIDNIKGYVLSSLEDSRLSPAVLSNIDTHYGRLRLEALVTRHEHLLQKLDAQAEVASDQICQMNAEAHIIHGAISASHPDVEVRFASHLASSVDPHGFMTQSLLATYPASVLLPFVPRATLHALPRSSDSLRDASSPQLFIFRDVFEGTDIEVAQAHLSSVCRAVVDLSPQSPSHASMVTLDNRRNLTHTVDRVRVVLTDRLVSAVQRANSKGVGRITPLLSSVTPYTALLEDFKDDFYCPILLHGYLFDDTKLKLDTTHKEIVDWADRHDLILDDVEFTYPHEVDAFKLDPQQALEPRHDPKSIGSDGFGSESENGSESESECGDTG